jgi:trans-2,3-dihydro-3-hydroxyanthranilate isomerase
MVRALNFFQVDTCTSKPFFGDTVAVVTQAMGLSEEEMVDIARELNQSGCVFVLPSIDPARAMSRLRYLTRTGEETISESSAIASICVLVEEKKIPVPIDGSLYYRIEVLPEKNQPVEVRCRSGHFEKAMMLTPIPTITTVSPEQCSASLAALRISEKSLHSGLEIMQVHDPDYILIPVADDRTLMKIELDEDAFNRMPLPSPLALIPYVLRSHGEGMQVIQRLFASKALLQLESVKFSSAAAVTYSLFKRGIFALKAGTIQVSIHQGIPQERIRTIDCEMRLLNGEVHSIRVGGQAVVVMTGKILLP